MPDLGLSSSRDAVMMSLHKLTAGDGYLYLIRQTAAHDAEKRGRATLSDYYSSKGETPGRWIGRGVPGLSQPAARELLTDAEREIWTVAPGSHVTEDQMKALFGLGMHPNAGQINEHLIAMGAPIAAARRAANLGRPFTINDAATELQRRLAVAYRDHNLSNSLAWNTAIEETERAKMRTTIARQLFTERYGREPINERELTGFIATQSRDQTTSTAGFDFTFSPVKSFSVLWALAPIELSRVLEQCHDQAVADTLEYLQDHAAFTRVGAQGVAQIDTDGFIAAAFTHRDSRAGDPDLHTHVAVSNKVRALGTDGEYRWLALDGQTIFKANVPASEFYNTRLEAYATELAGLVFEERPSTERGKRPVREVTGIPTSLCETFSSRRAAIKAHYTDLAKQFQTDHGREPTTQEAIALHQQATLQTRTAKHEPRSLAEQRDQWRTQAVEHLGSQHALSTMLVNQQLPRRRTVADVTDAWIAQQAHLVIETVSAARSSWQPTHVYAEAQRRIRAAGLATDRTLADTLTAAALAGPHSHAHARIHDTDLGEPTALRRRDGSSIYTRHNTHLFTSTEILAAEKRVIAAAGRTDGRRATAESVDMAFLEQKATRGRSLNPGQQAMVSEMACSGARVQLALAPAGAGKTTAMAALARSWEESGGHVLGLSPGANQAQLLREDIKSDTDTVDKFIWLHNNPDATDDPARVWFDAIDDKTLIIVDEAGKAGTLQLDAVITTALARGASVRLVGDDQQLASVSAGGVLRDIERTYGALNLTEVVRFKSRAEAQAGLALRDGDPTGLAFYADNQRIHVGSDDTILDMAYQRWAADRANGHDSIMLAPTNATVAQLNERARLDRLLDQAKTGDTSTSAREAPLGDGLRASVGDIVATRRNKRTLRIAGARDFVRNGYRWRVTKVGADGSLTVSRLDTGHSAVLPAWYVRQDVTLGYAATIDSSQGMTIGGKNTTGTCYVVGSDHLTRQQLYTALTRATDENHVFLSTAETDAHRVLTPKATHPDTAMDVLERVLARDGAQVSATTEQHNAEDAFTRLGTAARMYTHAIGALAETHCGPATMAAIDAAADELHPALTTAGAWPTLRAHLALIAAAGGDPIARLHAAADRGELHNAADPAAVLDWRIDPSAAHTAAKNNTGPLQWLPAIPAALTQDPDWAQYLQARHNLVEQLAADVRDAASSWDATTAPRWARPLLDGTPGIRAEIAVFRAAHDVDPADTRITGPRQYANRDQRIQKLLEQLAEKHLGHRDPNTNRFHRLVDAVDPRVRRDPYWPQLAAHLSTIARTDVDLSQLLADAASDGPLPDQMPGAALWWRLAGRLQPAVLETSTHQMQPAWLADLHTIFGTAIAETIAADPAFPRLVAAIDAADPTRWTPADLLHLAHDHLRDVDDDPSQPLRADEYARLLTYAIDLFAADSPYDHYDIPTPADAPLTPEEEADLQAQFPDPENPVHHPSDEAVLEMLGLGHGGWLIPPDLADALPPDPLDFADYTSDDLDFGDLLTDRPLTRPIPPALADVVAVRAAHRRAIADEAALRKLVIAGRGPAMQAAAAHLHDLRIRADRDRPHMLAVQDIMARWADADAHYETTVAAISHYRTELAALQADPTADPLDIASLRTMIDTTTAGLPDAGPAERFRDELTAALTARAEAAGGANNIVTADDVATARQQAMDDDNAALASARAHTLRLRNSLNNAETAIALAFAEAETRNADHITDHASELHTELAMLRAAGAYRIERGFTVHAEATTDLDDLTTRTLSNVARSGFTITALHTDDDATALAAMTALHTAAVAKKHRIIWCSTDPTRDQQARDAAAADIFTTLADLEARLAARDITLDTDTTVIVDHAETADPAALLALAERADTQHGRLLLVYSDDTGLPETPSGPLLKLLQRDLPWSGVITRGGPVARKPHDQPDRDSILDQAERCDPHILSDDINDALAERQRLRATHVETHRRHTDMWGRMTKPSKSRDTGTDLGR